MSRTETKVGGIGCGEDDWAEFIGELLEKGLKCGGKNGCFTA